MLVDPLRPGSRVPKERTHEIQRDRQPAPRRPIIQSLKDVPRLQECSATNIEFIVDRFLAAGTVCAITGDSGSGKTTLVSAICHSIASGSAFATREVKQRPVLILDRENPLPVVMERFDRLGIEDGDSFKIWGGWLPEEPPSPSSLMIVDLVKATDPKPVIVVDSLIAFHDGSENESERMRNTMRGFRTLADLGAAVVVIHHSGKGESTKEYRGSSDFKAGVDIAYVLTNLSSDPTRLDKIRLEAFKTRFQVDSKVVVEYRDGRFEALEAGESASADGRLSELLRQNPQTLQSDFECIAMKNGATRNMAREFLRRGIKDRSIHVEKGPNNAKRHTWVGDSGGPKR